MSISTKKLEELYDDTLQRSSSQNLQLSDSEIEYNIFEEFDIGMHSFLHDKSLLRLHDAGLINDEILELSQQLRKIGLRLQTSGKWNLESVKSDSEWKTLFELSDRISIQKSKK